MNYSLISFIVIIMLNYVSIIIIIDMLSIVIKYINFKYISLVSKINGQDLSLIPIEFIFLKYNVI